ncbi:hypothetical protein PTT_10992 [Pyrenophora teres f. teres 0-1]|uniref:Uncharacterized protein n=1 Tax=Pyrenophora teres f. teres (strain 0-1) TaxID=861557 RepID=E3RQI7_PYRTT|nr:hypothetical protein PTT_10992 [Pyrenophora teres f. teres 0-1]
MIAKRETIYSAGTLVTKEEIQEVDSLVVKAKQMVAEGSEKHNDQAMHRGQPLSEAIQNSDKLGVKAANVRQGRVDKGASLTSKSLPRQRLAGERIEKSANDYKTGLQESMPKEPTAEPSMKLQPSPNVCRSPISPEVYNATRGSPILQPPNNSETPPKSSLSKPITRVEMVTLNSGDTIPIVLSPTGFARFPRHCEDDDEWDRLSQSSAREEDGNTETERKPSPKKDRITS